jgi:outer membrane protein OmpA-like peptidoglycan-associated protein
MKLMPRSTAIIAIALFFLSAQGATREETLKRLDAVRAKRGGASAVAAWLNDARDGAGDRSKNALALGDVERLHVVVSEDAHVIAFRVDAFGDVRPFPGDLPKETPLKANVEATVPQEDAEALRRPPTGDEDIYVFATTERVDPDAIAAELRSASSSDDSPGPKSADRIAKRLNALPAESVSVAIVRLRVTPRRSVGTRGLSIDGDYTADDIVAYYENFSDTATRGFTPTRFPGLIHFATKQAVLSPKAKANLDSWASALTSSKLAGASFAIEGHTDDVGKDETNMALSKIRAEAVRDYLAQRGVATARLIPEPHGKKGPIREGTSDDARQANRRVDFRIVRMN